jgi:hypothetical protein
MKKDKVMHLMPPTLCQGLVHHFVYFDEAAPVDPAAFKELVTGRTSGRQGRIKLMLLGLENRFTYHPPKDGQAQKYELIRATALNLAHLIDDLAPESREKSVAITKLEEAVMWANAAIARNE